MAEKYYTISDLDKIKRNPLILCQYTKMFFEDLKKIKDFDVTIRELWICDYVFKFRYSQKGKEYSSTLYENIDFLFSN